MLTKKVGVDGDDEDDEQDREDISTMYKDTEGSASERLAIHNAVRGTKRAQRYYAFRDDIKEDCIFDLQELDSIRVGEDFKVSVSFILVS